MRRNLFLAAAFALLTIASAANEAPTRIEPAGGDDVTWTSATLATPWGIRSRFASASFGGMLWMMGGSTNNTHESPVFNDVWASEDGVHWILMAPSAGWSARRGMQACVFDNKLWLMGGFNYDTGHKNDVWNTTDGTDWNLVTSNAAWPGRDHFALTVHSGRMWVMGSALSSWTRDVWSSDDGVTWTRATAAAAWPARRDHVAVTYDGKMWVMGGRLNTGSALNDVWWSTNGTDWTRATAAAPWSPRMNHRAAVFADRMWVFDGHATEGKSDGWWSTDGVNWVEAFGDGAWRDRLHYGLEVLNETFYLYGGQAGDSSTLMDAWHANFLSIKEHSRENTFITTLSTVDADAGDTHTYTLTDDAGLRFAINGDRLVTGDGSRLDYDLARSHTVTVKSTDSGGLSVSRRMLILVLPNTEISDADGWMRYR